MNQKKKRKLFKEKMNLLQLGELVAERDEKLAVALPLVGGKGEDASNIVPVRRLFLFREVSHNVSAASKTKMEDIFCAFLCVNFGV